MHLQQSRNYHKKPTHVLRWSFQKKHQQLHVLSESGYFLLPFGCFYLLTSFLSVRLGNLLTMNLPKLSHIFQNTKTFNIELLEIPNSIPFFCRMRLVSGFVATQQKSNDFRHGNLETKAQYYSNDPSYIHLWKSNISGEMFLKLFQYKPLKSLGPCTNRYHTDICETFATDTILISVRHFRDGIKRYL